jgi:hypothetical protein
MHLLQLPPKLLHLQRNFKPWPKQVDRLLTEAIRRPHDHLWCRAGQGHHQRTQGNGLWILSTIGSPYLSEVFQRQTERAWSLMRAWLWAQVKQCSRKNRQLCTRKDRSCRMPILKLIPWALTSLTRKICPHLIVVGSNLNQLQTSSRR